MISGSPRSFETIGLRKDTSTFHIEVFTRSQKYFQSQANLIAVRDITERKEAENRLFHDAFHDPLNGLPNRALLIDRLSNALERAKRNPNYRSAVVFIDMDDFKGVNDAYGHAVGDRLLQEIASRLQRSIRGVDTAAHLGGDEFIILFDELIDGKTEIVVHRVLYCFDRPFILDQFEIKVKGSLGVVPDIRTFNSPVDVIHHAHKAMI